MSWDDDLSDISQYDLISAQTDRDKKWGRISSICSEIDSIMQMDYCADKIELIKQLNIRLKKANEEIG
jgi:hypothetical protein